MRSVPALLALLCLAAGCVDLSHPKAKVIDQPMVLPSLDSLDARDVLNSHDAGVSRDKPIETGPGQTDTAGMTTTDTAVDTGGAAPAPRKSLGEACASAGDCASGFCADGLCCDSACTGACVTCDSGEQPGTCSPVPAGEDPGEDCPLDAPATCGRDGTCDGAGACRRYRDETICAAGSCSAATERAASTCQAGVCQPGGTRSCAPGVCMGSSCGTGCSGPNDCQVGFYCATGKCQAKKATSVSCASAGECDSGFCVDGVCCASACTGSCQACNVAGKVGQCAAIPEGADPSNECPAQPGVVCGRVGACNGAGACRMQAAGTSCGTASCSAGRETTAATCNGVGTCSPGSTRDCGAYACGPSACRTSCTSVSDCAANAKCTGGLCLPNKIASLVVHDTERASDWGVRANFSIGQTGARPWLEWPNTYVSSMDAAANVLLGNEWIRVATDSKTYTGGPQATLTLGTAGDVYLFIDDRWGTSPSFMSGWSNAGFKIRVYESSTRPSLPFTAFRKSGVTGSVSLPAIGSTAAYNYFVVVY